MNSHKGYHGDQFKKNISYSIDVFVYHGARQQYKGYFHF